MIQEEWEYIPYATPLKMEKTLHTLAGMIKGIAIDHKVTNVEVDALLNWCSSHELASNKSPFSDIVPKLHKVAKDKIFDQEEMEDILWLCNQYFTPSKYYDKIASEMQLLQGLLAGIAADDVITEEELDGIRKWLSDHEYLGASWPFDEIDKLITNVMTDGRIDEDEHTVLLNYCSQFLNGPTGDVIDLPNDNELLLSGVCSSAPEVIFRGGRFCLTGNPEKGTKTDLAQIITDLGGLYVSKISNIVDYLVVGAKGSEYWAFASYGRKIEEAMNKRKEGIEIQIVHEYDFWNAVEDART